jgi:hypothetical protein
VEAGYFGSGEEENENLVFEDKDAGKPSLDTLWKVHFPLNEKLWRDWEISLHRLWYKYTESGRRTLIEWKRQGR